MLSAHVQVDGLLAKYGEQKLLQMVRKKYLVPPSDPSQQQQAPASLPGAMAAAAQRYMHSPTIARNSYADGLSNLLCRVPTTGQTQKAALLEWARGCCQGRSVPVASFAQSFSDGLAFVSVRPLSFGSDEQAADRCPYSVRSWTATSCWTGRRRACPQATRGGASRTSSSPSVRQHASCFWSSVRL